MAMRICIAILAGYIFLFILSRKEPAACVNRSGRRLPVCFVRMASLLIRRLRGSRQSLSVKADAQTEAELSKRYPAGTEDPFFCYRRDKLACALLIAAAGTLLSLGVCFDSRIKQENIERITRGSYGSEQTVALTARVETGYGEREETVDVTVEGREYTKAEIDFFMEEIRSLLPDAILGENEDVDHVTKPLFLMKQINDNPVTIRWNSSDYGLMDSRGNIQALELDEEGELCMLTAVLSCQGYEMEERFYVRICRGERTEEEQLREALRAALQEREGEDRTNDSFLLPQEFGGNRVIWQEKKDDKSVIILLLTMTLAVGIYYSMDRDLQKQIRRRKRRLLAQYPEFVSRLVLFMSAGMTIRGAMQKMAGDYEQRKRSEGGAPDQACEVQVYEEIVYTCHELDSGIPEVKAYYRLGRRCGETHYVRLCMLLSQNLKKGTAGLLLLLREEAADALEERRRNARRLGEEAGTKLLLPMMVMLLVVMVIIMVPAFLSFSV